MFRFLFNEALASTLGLDFVPQADLQGGRDSMSMFWIAAGVIVVAGIAALFAYKTFYD